MVRIGKPRVAGRGAVHANHANGAKDVNFENIFFSSGFWQSPSFINTFYAKGWSDGRSYTIARNDARTKSFVDTCATAASCGQRTHTARRVWMVRMATIVFDGTLAHSRPLYLSTYHPPPITKFVSRATTCRA